MTANETQSIEETPIPFGTRLKLAREALGLNPKEVAAQLRLHENAILMVESEQYPPDLPATFIRGYIRAYGKLLQVPKTDVDQAVAPILSKNQIKRITPIMKTPMDIRGQNYFMPFFTYLIFFTLAGLMGAWWYSHGNNAIIAMKNVPIVMNNQTIKPAVEPNKPIASLILSEQNQTFINSNGLMALNEKSSSQLTPIRDPYASSG